MNSGPSKLLWTTDPELADALSKAAAQGLVVVDLRAKVTGAVQDNHVWGERFVRLASRAANAQRRLNELEARVQLERARALDARMCRVRGIARLSSAPMPTVQLSLFPLLEPGPTPPRPVDKDLQELPELAEPTNALAAPADAPHTLRETSKLTCWKCSRAQDVYWAQSVRAWLCPACHANWCTCTPTWGGYNCSAWFAESLEELDDDEDLVDEDLVLVDEQPPGWCEVCTRERPGVAWCESRAARLCPGCWPAEALVVARVAA